MKVLLLTTHINTGGITSYLLTLGRGLVKAGHQVIVVSSGGECAENFRQAGVVVETLNIRTKSEINWRLLAALPRVVALIRGEKIDVLHANTRVTQILAVWASRLTGVPVVTTCHGFYRLRWFRRAFPAWGEAVVAISPAVREHLKNDFHYPEEKVFLINNGLDVDNFPLTDEVAKENLRRQFHWGAGPILGIIARLADVKGHAVLINALPAVLKEFPSVHLVIVGEGKMGASLRRQVEELKLSTQVIFLPVVNRTIEILPAFDIFVMPSLSEGLGLAAVEAAAVGLPVVASRVGGLPSVVIDGKTGRLVAPNNVVELASALKDLLRDPDQARQMGLAGRAFIEKEFSARRMTEETLAVYRSVVKK